MPLQAFRELSDRTRTGDRLDHNQNQAGTRGHFRPVCAANDGDRVAGTGRALRLECSEIVLSDAGFVNQFVEIPALYRESVAAEGGCAGALRWSSCAEVGSDRRPDVSSVASVSRRGTARGRGYQSCLVRSSWGQADEPRPDSKATNRAHNGAFEAVRCRPIASAAALAFHAKGGARSTYADAAALRLYEEGPLVKGPWVVRGQPPLASWGCGAALMSLWPPRREDQAELDASLAGASPKRAAMPPDEERRLGERTSHLEK